MPKIQTILDKKTQQIKYQIILPKSVMEDLSVQQSDELRLKSIVGYEITFTLKRKSEIEAEKKKQLQQQLEKLK